MIDNLSETVWGTRSKNMHNRSRALFKRINRSKILGIYKPVFSHPFEWTDTAKSLRPQCIEKRDRCKTTGSTKISISFIEKNPVDVPRGFHLCLLYSVQLAFSALMIETVPLYCWKLNDIKDYLKQHGTCWKKWTITNIYSIYSARRIIYGVSTEGAEIKPHTSKNALRLSCCGKVSTAEDYGRRWSKLSVKWQSRDINKSLEEKFSFYHLWSC